MNLNSIICGNCFEILNMIPKKSVNMIFADPPYFLSNNGVTCQSGKMVSVNKGEWDKKISPDIMHKYNRKWIKKCKKLLTDDGSIFISGTLHNIYSIGMALVQEGFIILNNITWEKLNPPPNLSCKMFTHSTETILWAKINNNKQQKFNYKIMKKLNNGKQMKDVWRGSTTSKKEKTCGKHPTQKPLYILEKIILASTDENDIILDPFAGSGTTLVAAKKLKRNFIGIEMEYEYCEIIKERLKQI